LLVFPLILLPDFVIRLVARLFLKHRIGEATTMTQQTNSKQQNSVPIASTSDTLGFVFECGLSTKVYFSFGILFATGNGIVFPLFAWLLSKSYSGVLEATTGE
jgi:hypothetical protein